MWFGKLTQEASHVYGVLQWHTAYTIRQHVGSMAMHHTVDGRKSLVYLTMDVPLEVAWLRILLDRLRTVHVVFNQIVL